VTAPFDDALEDDTADGDFGAVSEYLWAWMSAGFLSVFGLLLVRDRERRLRLSEMFVDIAGKRYALRFLPKAGLSLFRGRLLIALYRIRIPREDLEALSTQTGVRLVHVGSDGRWFDRPLGFAQITRLRLARRSRLYPVHGGESRAFIRQAAGTTLFVTVRPCNHTDSLSSQAKVIVAQAAALLYRQKAVLLYEKESQGYEESASVVFESLVDSGHENVYFILDPASAGRVPERYRDRIVERFSFKHYYLFFCARAFVGTELMSHAIELRTVDQVLLHHLARGRYTYVFLQHGVMYMVSLDSSQRGFFRADRLPKRSRIVCSSELEARHFVELGGFDPRAMYVCGLPKFDRARLDPDADAILITPTWHPWEANTIRTHPTESLYYRMIAEMYAAVPDELKHQVWVLPHRLVRESLATTDLADHMWKGDSYDEALRRGALLITDYSSISYDAFYRGANVIFWWKEKDYCMEQYGGHLMLEEATAFGPVCYTANELTRAVGDLYLTPQDEEYLERYRKIVEFHDGHNTDRLIELMERDGLI